MHQPRPFQRLRSRSLDDDAHRSVAPGDPTMFRNPFASDQRPRFRTKSLVCPDRHWPETSSAEDNEDCGSEMQFWGGPIAHPANVSPMLPPSQTKESSVADDGSDGLDSGSELDLSEKADEVEDEPDLLEILGHR